MLLEQTHYPQSKGGNIPWGTILIVAVVIGGVAYAGYKMMPKIEPNSEPQKQII